MKLAIMQPYFMPYFSYFKLIKSVDRFILLDDVNYIKKGWINRNQILVNNKAYLFSLPIKGASQNNKIKDLVLMDNTKWQLNLLKTIKQSYQKSPQFDRFYPLLEKIVNFNDLKATSYIRNSLELTCKYLNIETEILASSSVFKNQELTGQYRILDICKKNGCSEYLNLPGGKKLYDLQIFRNEGIKLSFLNENDVTYMQFTDERVKNLSIIDYLMFNNPSQFTAHCDLNIYA